MFDMQSVGKSISTLRKARNMTQMELADRLNISFQAVSNWERGQTMPDIAKLSDLAAIFGVTVDELLGNSESARVVKDLIREAPIADEISTEEFLDVAPLVKPKQAESLWKKVKPDISLKELAMAAPFLSESTVDMLSIRAAQREHSLKNLSGLLPFMSQQAVDTCMEYIQTDEVDIKNLISAAPFMSQQSLNRLADQVLQKGSVKDLVALAPFLEQEKLTEAAEVLADSNGFAYIMPLLPFLDKKLLDSFFLNRKKNDR